MTKMTVKHNKKEEQKKLIVRIVCLVLVIALVVTSLLTVFPSLFQTVDPELQAMIDAGYVYQAEDGNYYYTDEYVQMLTGLLTTEDSTVTEDAADEAGHSDTETESHEGHNHD